MSLRFALPFVRLTFVALCCSALVSMPVVSITPPTIGQHFDCPTPGGKTGTHCITMKSPNAVTYGIEAGSGVLLCTSGGTSSNGKKYGGGTCKATDGQTVKVACLSTKGPNNELDVLFGSSGSAVLNVVIGANITWAWGSDVYPQPPNPTTEEPDDSLSITCR